MWSLTMLVMSGEGLHLVLHSFPHGLPLSLLHLGLHHHHCLFVFRQPLPLYFLAPLYCQLLECLRVHHTWHQHLYQQIGSGRLAGQPNSSIAKRMNGATEALTRCV